MCNTPLHLDTNHNSFSNFSTLQLLRTCNRLLLPNSSNSDMQGCYDFPKETNDSLISAGNLQNFNNNLLTKSPDLNIMDSMSYESTTKSLDTNENSTLSNMLSIDTDMATLEASPIYRTNGLLPIQMSNFGFLQRTAHKKTTLPAFQYIAPPCVVPTTPSLDFPLMEMNRTAGYPLFLHRRARGEKRPIPDEQKDDKYYERRKRNNEAAKKSRDARKLREDRIAFRAALLEQENSILRAQVLSLRDELQTIRQIMTVKKSTTTN